MFKNLATRMMWKSSKSSNVDSNGTEQSTTAGNTATKSAIKREILAKINEWSYESTAHGLPPMVRKKNILTKLTWSVFTLASVGLCCFMVIRTITQYLEFDVVTKIRKEIKPNVTFPLIIVCNVNPMITPEASNYLLERVNVHYNLSLRSLDEMIEKLAAREISLSYMAWLQYQSYRATFNQTLRRSFGYNAADMIQYASLYGSDLSVEDEFEWYYDVDMGNCFTFNSNSTYKQDFTDDGLLLEMFTDGSDGPLSNFYLNRDAGFMVSICDQNLVPIRKDGLFVKPGSLTQIGFTRVESETLSGVYSECVDADLVDTLIANEMKSIGVKYTRKNCIDLLMVKIAMDTLGCYEMKYPRILNATPCDDFESFKNLSKLSFNYDNYMQYCPYECASVTYALSVSSDVYPTRQYFNFKLAADKAHMSKLFGTDNVTYEMYAKSVASVLIKIDDLQVTHISESASVTLPDLLANLGGTIGLFLGVSILSFVEAIELVIEILYIIFTNSKQNTVHQN